MLDRLARLLEVSPAVAVVLLVLTIAQLGTQAYALVQLARSNAVRGGRKWVWALVIALGNLPGAIAFLAAGRPAPQVDVPGAGSGASPAGSEAARRAVDVLYNSRDER